MGQKGQGQGQGKNGGQASGQRAPGTEEGVSFNPEKAKIKANELDRNGEIIAVLPFNGDMPKGEALREYKEALKTAQDVAEQVNKDAIPRERQDMVRRYMKTLVQPVGGTESTEPAAPAGGKGGSAEDGAGSEGR